MRVSLRKAKALPALVLLGGVIFSLYMQTLIPGEVFTVGDAGLKALLTRQLSQGVPHLDLRLPAEPWVRALWDGGLYPFESPNVVAVGDERFITFPFTFPLVSAPFYRLFGFRGLYVLPLVSLWLVWAGLWVACRGLRLGGVVTAAVLAAVVFASPLTWYSATFWEHTLAVALAFQGLAMALATPAGRPLSPRASFTAGALLGASVWLREELLCLVGLMVVLALAAPWLAARGWAWLCARPRPFLAGLLLPPALFLLANSLVYGHLLGLHGAGALKSFSRSQWSVAVVVLRGQLVGLVEYFPVLLIGLLGVPVLVAVRRRAVGNALLFLALAIAFAVAVPLLVRTGGGRQWGPRFMLVLVPLLALASGLTLKRAMRLGRPWRSVSVAVFAVLFGGGAWLNSYRGTAYLRGNYQRRMIPFLFVSQDDARYVVVSHESVAAQLAGTFDRKTYFLATHGMDLRLLAREMASHGEARFLYLCYPPYGCGPFGEDVRELTFYTGGGRPFARFSSRGAFDRYVVYEVACWPRTRPSDGESP